MLEVLFKDFMALLVTICNHGNSKKCKRLFDVYQTSLFEQIDIGNMEVKYIRSYPFCWFDAVCPSQ